MKEELDRCPAILGERPMDNCEPQPRLEARNSLPPSDAPRLPTASPRPKPRLEATPFLRHFDPCWTALDVVLG